MEILKLFSRSKKVRVAVKELPAVYQYYTIKLKRATKKEELEDLHALLCCDPRLSRDQIEELVSVWVSRMVREGYATLREVDYDG